MHFKVTTHVSSFKNSADMARGFIYVELKYVLQRNF